MISIDSGYLIKIILLLEAIENSVNTKVEYFADE